MNPRLTKEEIQQIYKDSNNELVDIALKYNSTKITDPECVHYCEHYWKHFKDLRDKPLNILEIGVKDGDSLNMWEDFFHPSSTICGIDINPLPETFYFKKNNSEFFILDQSDVAGLIDLINEIGKFDIIIDDGSHKQYDIITSFNTLFLYGLNSGGKYVIEDLGTSYWYKWGGGINNRDTAIDYLKNKVDNVNYEFWKGDRHDYVGIPDSKFVDVTPFDKTINSVEFCKGMCFISKK